MELDNQLQRYRKLHGWSKGEFAEKAGVSRSTVYALEEKRSFPKIDVVYRIALLLNIPVHEVFFPKGDTPKLRVPDEFLEVD